MRTAIDTNLLIILLRGKPADQAELVAQALIKYDGQGQLLISPIVWAELKVLISTKKLDSFLKDSRILIDWEQTAEVWSAAADAFARYLENRRRGKTIQHCTCGREINVICPDCGKMLGFPRHIPPDFLVAAHALHRADLLLTADKGIPQRYFPALRIGNPLEPTGD
ncbi:MAG: hypothetical protein PWP72_388 [Thermoanaerobacter sp.]|nr:hypothetical protein [Thermoanaerobacter sp.]